MNNQFKSRQKVKLSNSCLIMQRSDVYAFGIILHEIFGRRGPWGKQEHSYRELQGE
jgi:hypothetical protein